ncbi:ribonuclease H-like domain-containing protein [Paenibacillus sp. FJAT-26967]|uniref:ribonuclease H-like domain-containing protein n=1 Tax=Paenibacillus sp. FJAT-26967 TaxID=1729690 RepID=UPI000A037DE5|nr:ribonuclease H-like domain-containing protein [Paenibacillus sp. FJAT-26967]
MSGLRDKLARHLKPSAQGQMTQASAGGGNEREPEGIPQKNPDAGRLSDSPADSGLSLDDALQGASGSGTAADQVAHNQAAAAVPESAASQLQASESADAGESREWDKLGAELYESPHGSFVRRVCTYPLHSYHGKYRLDDLQGTAHELNAFHPDQAPPDARGLLFFDTETTGLGVGAGNLAFMVGIGYYDTDVFVVEQLLIRHPAEERAMLAYLGELMERFTHIVSYNGRTFDWPILQNRYVMNRMRLNFDKWLHLDLLHPSRSLWKHAMPSCRLGKVEEAQLGYAREEDVSGALAPELYFLYLAEGKTDVLRGVFVHNERDIVSLAALSVLISRYLSEEEPLALKTSADLFRLGQWLLKMGRNAPGESVMELGYGKLIEGSSTETRAEGSELFLHYAAYYKKAGLRERAVDLWNRQIRQAKSTAIVPVEAYIELAMHYEHSCKDYSAALEMTREALDTLRRRRKLLRKNAKDVAEERQILHRAERLERKLENKPKPVPNRKSRKIADKPRSDRLPKYATPSLFDLPSNLNG